MADADLPPVVGEFPPEWHNLPAQDALAAFGSVASGLDAAVARHRLEQYGPNRLPVAAGESWLKRFLRQFDNVLIYVLLASAAVTALLGHWADCSVIVGVVLINAVIGVLQEGRAEQAINAIRAMLSSTATVLRDGQRLEVPAETLVVGDVVLLSSGDKVPADLRLLEARQLRIEESALTGESVAVEKGVAAVAVSAALADRSCMAYSGTLVVFGQARGVVVATGSATEIGRISALIAAVDSLETPLLRQMAGFGRQLTVGIMALSVLAFAFGVLLRGYALEDMFLAAVGIAVAAIPEGLPAIMTIILAIGEQRMARRNAIVRKLPAVETLGAVTVICSDKTGTLTQNAMTVQQAITAEHAFGVSGVGYLPHGGFSLGGRDVSVADHPELIEMGRAALLCNEASFRRHDDPEQDWQLQGDPTEGALLALAAKVGLDIEQERDFLQRTDLIPFESQHRFMATLHHDHLGRGRILLKGAPEQVLMRCVQQRERGEDRPLAGAHWQQAMRDAAASGFRLLALAEKPALDGQRELHFSDVDTGLVLLGVLAIADPPREAALASVSRCREAGIRVKMITGDHLDTACAIGARFGLRSAGALTGSDIDALPSDRLRAAVLEADIFARASPEHKLALVEALQAEGEVVAMTGDGVNDAPALKRADVGVAMGMKGTEAAREAAEMVLADDNFASIDAAVEEGRTVYDNLRKSIVFTLPTNGGEAAVIVAAILLGVALPITPVQILWVNMVTAVTLSLALAFEPAEADVMRRRPRPAQAPLLDRFLAWRVALVSGLMVLGALGFFLYEQAGGASVEVARTVAVNALVAGEIFYLLNCRYLLLPAFMSGAPMLSRAIVLAVAIVAGLQLFFTYHPALQAIFGTAALDAAAWGRIALFGILVFVLVELEKAWLRARTAP